MKPNTKTNKLVEIIEIWQPVKTGGEAYYFKNNTNLERIAVVANGKPIFLKKDFVMERKYMEKKEFDFMTKPILISK